MTLALEAFPEFVFFAQRSHWYFVAHVAPADEEAGAKGGRPGPADDRGIDGSGNGVESHFCV